MLTDQLGLYLYTYVEYRKVTDPGLLIENP